MSRPGDRVRHLAARLCSERARKRLVDPAVADLQAEAAAAERTGSSWQMCRTLAAGYVSLAKVLVIAVGGDVRASVTGWNRDEASHSRRGAWVVFGITLVATALLELPLLRETSFGGSGERILMAIYLAPSTLALSVPSGLAVASAWMLHGAARTRKLAGMALLSALLASPVMFANLGWVTPDANQAFREMAFAHYAPTQPAPRRGDGELRFAELRAALDQARRADQIDDVRHLETLYYRKWSFSVTPFTMVALIVALAFWRPWTRAGPIGIAAVLVAANYALVMVAFPLVESGVAGPIVIEWAGNAFFAAATVVIICSRSRVRRPA